MAKCKSDCRAEDGITIGLIDSIITQCRLLKPRNLKPKNVQEALKDLADDEDMAFLINQIVVVSLKNKKTLKELNKTLNSK